MKTIRVRILSDGITAKEVNPLGIVPRRQVYVSKPSMQQYEDEHGINRQPIADWHEAESKLRTFEIDRRWENMFLDSDSVHQAELLPNGKIKLID